MFSGAPESKLKSVIKNIYSNSPNLLIALNFACRIIIATATRKKTAERKQKERQMNVRLHDHLFLFIELFFICLCACSNRQILPFQCIFRKTRLERETYEIFKQHNCDLLKIAALFFSFLSSDKYHHHFGRLIKMHE